ncbi:MAG: SulP family inorganic anion transporter [Reichenbachiella sp.]
MKEAHPSTGFKGIIHHWKDDFAAAISVSLVALPLTLGIALASGAPPMSGLIAAILGGIFTTFFRGSFVGINGPTAGLIVVVLSGVESLSDADGSGFKYVLAAIVVAGVLQVILGLLKLGKLGDLFPSSVVSGMLATIGLIIFIKQFHVALGVTSESQSAFDSLLEIPHSLMKLNPVVTMISVISLFILIFHTNLKSKFLKSIPGPLQVLIVSIPIVFVLNEILDLKNTTILNYPLYIDQSYLISMPENLMDSFIFPDFSKSHLPEFWLLVILITLVASLESLISTKAIDKLDHFKRRTDLNKDLFAVGLSTVVSGFLGGLPVITVIVRSSVNINHNAKTKWSNFYHGVIILAFVVLFPAVIKEIPQACLAAILLYTGFKLASPTVFKATWMKGWEQLFIMIITIFFSLVLNLLWGIIIGVVATLFIQWVRSENSLGTFVKHLFNTHIKVLEESKNVVHVEIIGIANFAIMLKLINKLTDMGSEKNYVVDFSRTKLIDSTVLDFIHEHREKYFTQTNFEFVGLDVHKTSSPHPLALHVLERPMQKRLTGRQNEIYHFAAENKYRYSPEISWNVKPFENFAFFEFHLLEYIRNKMAGDLRETYPWVIADVTYNDGILMAREGHNVTVMVISLPERLYDFLITKEDIRRLKSYFKSGNSLDDVPGIIKNLVLLIEDSASYYIESLGHEILIYRKERLLSNSEIIDMHNYAIEMLKFLPRNLEEYKRIKTYF